ncbi:hypothetical protein HPB47_026573 [Ixodes persulcatus]|uniref:Uncharacterized protein n=1 Tax=Ixodes persulcatus TaxID=34615 RepID=A0AC60Q0A1_IXOPE|nr:hypothetical protein HPB47_026573 [Ixodes persulcatus]
MGLRNTTAGTPTFIRAGVQGSRALLDERLKSGIDLTEHIISNALEAATRIVQVPSSRPNPDPKWLELRAQRRRAQRRSWRTGRPEDVLKYRRLDAKFRRHGKKLARRHWRLLCGSLHKRAGGSKDWKMANALARRPSPRTPVLSIGLARNLTPLNITEVLADAFTSAPTTPTTDQAPQNWRSFCQATAPPMQSPDADFKLHELQIALRSSPRHRSALEQAKAQKWSAVMVFLDVSKAFDAVPHTTIISALRTLGVRGRPFQYACAFLSGRTMRVRIGSLLSEPRKIVRGVPQGSVISPLLFSLAISSLPTAAKVGEKPNYPINMAVYADDVALWATSSSHRRQTMVREVPRAITNTIY